jgi:D-3-phosphoglycerate dehydrogenase / 2-oxoglutarate reductase
VGGGVGGIASSIADGALQRIDVEVRGEVAELDVRVLELAALKGVMQGLVHDPVSYVNAPVLAQQRGVEVALTTDRDSEDHRNLVRVRLTLSDGTWVSVAGTAAGPKGVHKLVEVDQFDVDVPISEHMACLRYHDRPGVVGTVGRILGEVNVNIGGMQVSPDNSGDHAVIVLTLDQAVSSDVLERIVADIGAHTGRAVDLAF